MDRQRRCAEKASQGMTSDPLFIPLIVSLLITAVEWLAARIWWPLYFRIGIPVYRRTFLFGGAPTREVTAESLEEDLQASRGDMIYRIEFRAFSDGEIAFREDPGDPGPSSRLRYIPVMHGLLSIDLRQGTASVVGRLNWSVIGLALMFVLSFYRGAQGWAVACVAALFSLALGYSYVAQAKRYTQVFRVAERYFTLLSGAGDRPSGGKR